VVTNQISKVERLLIKTESIHEAKCLGRGGGLTIILGCATAFFVKNIIFLLYFLVPDQLEHSLRKAKQKHRLCKQHGDCYLQLLTFFKRQKTKSYYNNYSLCRKRK